jgi:hypothetical protein
MFLKDGKSLLGNWGLIVSLVILIVLVFFSYNKCMAPGMMQNKNEGFVSAATGITKDISFPPPQNPRINITGSTITLNFTVNIAAGTQIPTQFMVILVQYDSTLTPTGNNKFYISNESVINPSVSNISSATGNATSGVDGVSSKKPINNSLCQLINGSPTCSYVFKNLDMIDTAGNPYYYKLGVSAVYSDGNSKFVIPYNVINSSGIFSLATTLDAQNNQFNDYIKYKQLQTTLNNKSNNVATISTPDGQYELIKNQLGGYPSNLIMDPTSAKQNMLADLVDKSMAQAVLNVNVDV